MTSLAKPIYRVVDKRKGNLIAPSALRDFVLDEAPLPDPSLEEVVFTPYALDLKRRAVVEVGMPRIPVAQPRAFFYLDQYEEARAIRLSPVAAYADVISTSALAPRRIFVFSIGRAGSTLVSQILGAAGIAALSEPDIFLGLGQRRQLVAVGLDRDGQDRLYCACIASLESALGPPATLAVKFRAQSSNQFHMRRVLRLFPTAHYVFLFRAAEAWSLSFTRKFGFQHQTLKWLMTENLKAADMARNAGVDVRILNYSDILHDPTRLLQGLVEDPKEVDLSPVLASDSQHGLFTEIHDSNNMKVVDASSEHEFFMKWWRSEKPKELLDRLGLDL